MSRQPRRASSTVGAATARIVTVLAGSWSSLVQELLEEILKYLSDEYVEWRATQDAAFEPAYRSRDRKLKMPRHPVLSASLVNRHWNAIATKQLYATIYLFHPKTTELFYRTCNNYQIRAEHVRVLSVDYKYDVLPQWLREKDKELTKRKRTARLTWSLLGMLKPRRVLHLSIDGPSLLPVEDSFTIPDNDISCLQSLKGLAVRFNSDVFNEWMSLLWVTKAASTLERLNLPSWLPSDFEDKLDDIRLPALKSLAFDGQTDCIVSRSAFLALTRDAKLEDLSFGFLQNVEVDDIVRVIQRSADHLLRLQLHFRRKNYGSDVQPSDVLTTLVDALRQCTRLQVLNLTIYDDAFGPSTAVDELLFPVLPQSLEHLTINRQVPGRRGRAETADILEALVSRQQLPNLKTLRMVPEAFRYQRERSPDRPSVECRERCNQRGLSFSYLRECPRHLPWAF